MTILQKIVYWTPRILSIALVLFISIFSLDVFSEYSGLAIILPLSIHLVPSFILLVAILIAWKFDRFGALIFIGFAIFYVWNVGFDKHWSWYVSIALPSAIIGVLYLLSWFQKRRRV